ncbi:nucleotidyltransferase domain-containing protein [bacterium]|nr:nucleotidyltransferase domain-containing protein [bacterium]
MDIFKLTKSKTREEILRLFFLDTRKRYYLREIERILNISVGNIRRELLSLEKSGLFKHEEVGNQVYYSVNKEAPVFDEFSKIVSKTIGVGGIIKNALKKIKGIKLAFIFGSYAKGKEDSLSDIDLMVIGKPSEDELISEILKVEKKLSREVNYHIFSLADWEKRIKGDNSFFKNILSQAKIFLIGDKNELSRIS